MPGRVLIVEPDLVGERGHQAAAVRRFAELIGRDRAVIVGGATWKGPLSIAGVRVVALFKYHRHAVARIRRYGPMVGRALTLADIAAEPVAALIRCLLGRRGGAATAPRADANGTSMASVMIDDMQRCLDALGVDAGDRLFLPSADAELMLATAELLNASDRAPAVHLRLMYDDAGCHPTDPTWRSALTALMRARGARERARLLVETDAFAAAVRELWEGPVVRLPHPSDLSPSLPPPMAEGFSLYVPGESRDDKGRHLLSAVVRALAARVRWLGRPVSMRVQGEAIAGSGAVQVTRLPRHVARVDYETNWHRSHAALLLHDPRFYARRGSGVACDAVATGRPFVCLKGAALSEWGVHGNVVAAEPDPVAIADAVGRLIESYDDYVRAAQVAAARFPETVRAGLAGLIAPDSGPQ